MVPGMAPATVPGTACLLGEPHPPRRLAKCLARRAPRVAGPREFMSHYSQSEALNPLIVSFKFLLVP